ASQARSDHWSTNNEGWLGASECGVTPACDASASWETYRKTASFAPCRHSRAGGNFRPCKPSMKVTLLHLPAPPQSLPVERDPGDTAGFMARTSPCVRAIFFRISAFSCRFGQNARQPPLHHRLGLLHS